VGGVSGRPTREAKGAIFSRARPSQRWKALWSTGSRQPSREVGRTWVLAGPSRLHGARSRTDDRTGDNGCSLDAEEGNVVSMRQAHALFLETPNKRSPRSRTTSFARSRGPCTSIATKLHRRKPREVARSVRYRGRANLRKQEEPAPRSERTDAARLAACHRFSSEKVVRDTSEKEGGHGLRPCEETRAPVSVRTSLFRCRSRQAGFWSQISSHAALQKEWR